MIGMKDQCFGVEVEMTGLTRGQAAQALANYFGTEPYYVGGGYDKWSVKDPGWQGMEHHERFQHCYGNEN